MYTKKSKTKQFWNWLWNSPLLSWATLILLISMFILMKFLLLPTVGLIMGTPLPLAIVESSSMDHEIVNDGGRLVLCNTLFEKNKNLNYDEYWDTCGNWYEEKTNITKEQFSTYKLSNGFKKGDLIIIRGKKDIQIGDIIIFNAGANHPIIHRVISLNPIQTKGDHNPSQLSIEQSINENQIIGVAVGKIPYIGWLKLFLVEHPFYFMIILAIIAGFYIIKENKE